MIEFMGLKVPKLIHNEGFDNCQKIDCSFDCESVGDYSQCLFSVENKQIRDKWLKIVNAAPELYKTLNTLYDSFQHVKGNTKGNKAKTDIIKFNEDVRFALSSTTQLLLIGNKI